MNLYKYILVSSLRNNLEVKFKVKIFSVLECDIQTICTLNQESSKQTFYILSRVFIKFDSIKENLDELTKLLKKNFLLKQHYYLHMTWQFCHIA